jgi:acetyl-CoA synthetase/medium-chain acyl-CoA synthetase
MTDYKKEVKEFSLHVPENFSFPLDVFDKWIGIALIWTDGKKTEILSFKDLSISSSKGAGAFRKLGLKKYDKVLVMLPNIVEWWEIMLALMRINAIAIPATTLLTVKDLEYRFSITDIRAVITIHEETNKVEEALKDISKDIILITIGEKEGWYSYKHEKEKADIYEGDKTHSYDPALIFFTSGTTGPPKMVLHSHASYPLAHLITGKYWLDLRKEDVHWNLSDTGWAKAAWSSLFGPWHMGSTIFSYYRKGKFDPNTIIEILENNPITTFCGPPTAYRMIAKEVNLEDVKFKSMRHFVAAGEPLNKEIIEIWKEKTGFYIYDGYGQTETVNVLANFRCIPIKPGSMGMPVPGFEVEIVDEKGDVMRPYVEGDIAIRVEPKRPVGLFQEYLNNPGETSKCYRGQWYITGDRAYKDEDGYFWFVGRSDDIILTSGYRIGPFEIESILIKHPAVKESAVVASPDEVRGEVVKAFIVLTEGFRPSNELIKELQDFVKSNTAPYKYPRKIEFVEELPKTISGKIKRKELKIKEFMGK